MNNDIFSLALMTAILIGAALYISRPILALRRADLLEDEYAETPMQKLLSRKDSIYTALKDLEFDYTTDKISPDDYRVLRDKFIAEAAEVLKEIDDFEVGVKQPADSKKAAVSDEKSTAVASGTCDACGFEFKPGDRFCQSCGGELG